MTSEIACPIRPFIDERAGAISSKTGAAAEAGPVDEEVMDEEETFGERIPRVPRRPLAPTKAEVEAHMPLHVDYRSWCPHCVAGKGISHHHATVTEAIEKMGSTVSVDYCFWVPEEAEDDMCPILVAYEDTTRALWVITVDKKGAGQSAVNWLADKLEHYGFSGTRITMKSDQESSIVACKRGFALKREAPTALI